MKNLSKLVAIWCVGLLMTAVVATIKSNQKKVKL